MTEKSPEFMTCPHLCPYCGALVEKVDSIKIYKTRSFGDVVICTRYPECDAFVGCHRSGDQKGQPKGTLANSELRSHRKAAHAVFDELWMSGRFKKRSWAYAWLSRETGIAPEKCHIGMMEIAQCELVVRVCRASVVVEPPW